MKTMNDIGDIRGKTILVRVDFNVPMDNGKVSDTTRIKASARTIDTLSKAGAKVALLSHFGRPKGVPSAEFSLQNILTTVSDVLGVNVEFAQSCHGAAAKTALAALPEGGVLMLENTRFEGGETTNDAALAKAIASLGDVFVSDAFSIAHRAHASNYGVAELLPAYAGLSLAHEMLTLEGTMSGAEKPVMAVVGGAKISSKINVLTHLITKMDRVFIGGGMANTFLAAQGHDMGKSLVEQDQLETARAVMAKATQSDCKIILPSDGLFAIDFKQDADHRIASITDIKPNEMMLDIGPDSIAAFTAQLADTKTVLWNGPMGAFELRPFDTGTVQAAQAVAAKVVSGDITAIAGGGDTVSALNHAGVGDQFSHLSTAGGAFLEWLEGKPLPGVAILA